MKKLLYGLLILLLLIMLLLCVAAPWGLIGVLIFVFGFYQLVQKNRGNVTFSKPGWFIICGFLLFMVLGMMTVPSVEETTKTANDTEITETVEEEEQETAKTNKLTAKVLSVTDGDTLKADVDGKEETIRLILIDTPETKHPQLGKQPLGEEASTFTTEQLTGKQIEIEPGVEERDRYGRLLAYVYINGNMFNETLVEKGYARVAVYPPNTKYLEQLEKAQSTAQTNGTGIWEKENYVTEDGFDVVAYEPEPEPVAEEPISESEPVVEAPEPIVEEPVEEEPATESVYYENCSAAKAAGAAPVHTSDPGYASHLDRDGDGIGCDS